jgi:hypothetical protein
MMRYPGSLRWPARAGQGCAAWRPWRLPLPLPAHEIQERRIDKFEHPRLRALSTLKRRAEDGDMTGRPTSVYVAYIESTPERVWQALTDPGLTAAYWDGRPCPPTSSPCWRPGMSSRSRPGRCTPR